ncbi:hypothetical protein E9232_001116 [Inquilinus ginsengisoli]|uniref:Type II toxin-antitoxin system VapC family toxin n=1 Tax=Inquilinus ginsengisoli TaxID=363840 RepID=A0ABU1JJ12_9PROT|nr:YciI family protein [Inquilinus ginsengisoli]MDR6288609.1 hypothetical protein [Inquilinus ginsengisoli]
MANASGQDEAGALRGLGSAHTTPPASADLAELAASNTRSLRAQPGGEALITDGPHLGSKEYMGGFQALEAADLDTAAARRNATLHVPDPRPIRDGLIAATALVHGLTVVTRNTADFDPTGVRTLNPWLP